MTRPFLRKVYIRCREGYPDNPNMYAAYDGFRQLGVETAQFEGFGDIAGLSDLGPEVALSGYVGDVLAALAQLGKPRPPNIDYPEELRPWLGREVWRSTLGQVRRMVDPVFFKPVEEKLFTGFVWRSPDGDRMRVATFGDDVEVWVSDRIDFVSEFRCFVNGGKIVGCRQYNGDWSRALDRQIVESAVKAYTSSPQAYSIDFGVTRGARTLLVEVNDAYALGAYGLPSVLYANMVEARWSELML